MKLAKISTLLLLPMALCAAVPETNYDIEADVSMEQLGNQEQLAQELTIEQGLALFFNEAHRVANEAIVEQVKAMNMENGPSNLSELFEMMFSDEAISAAQFVNTTGTNPITGLLGGLGSAIGSLTGTVGTVVNTTLSNPTTTVVNPLTGLLGGVLGGIGSTVGTVVSPNGTVNGLLGGLGNLTGGLLGGVLNTTGGLLGGALNTTGGLLGNPLNLTNILGGGALNLTDILGGAFNITGGLLGGLGNLTSGLGNLTDGLLGGVGNLTTAAPGLLGGVLGGIVQNLTNGVLDNKALQGIIGFIGNAVNSIVSGSASIPQLIEAVVGNLASLVGSASPLGAFLQNLAKFLSQNQNGILFNFLRLAAILQAVIKAVLQLVSSVVGNLGQGVQNAIAQIIFGVVGRILTGGLLRVQDMEAQSASDMMDFVRSIMEKAMTADPSIVSVLSNPTEENIANAIAVFSQVLSQDSDIAA